MSDETNITQNLCIKVEEQGKEILDLKLRLEKIETLVSNLLESSNGKNEQSITNQPPTKEHLTNERVENINDGGVDVDMSQAAEQKGTKRKSSESIENDVQTSGASKPIARSLNDVFTSEKHPESANPGQSSSSLSSAPVVNDTIPHSKHRKRNVTPKSKMIGIQVEKTFNYFGKILKHIINDGEMVWQAEFEDGERLQLDLDDVVDAVARFDEQGGKRKTINTPSDSPKADKIKEIIDCIQSDPTCVVGRRILKPFLVDGEVHSIIGAKFEVLFQNGVIEEMSASEIDECICKEDGL